MLRRGEGVKALYLDTNVIVARYKPDDPLFNTSEELFRRENFKFIISPVTLFELFAVFSRVMPHLSLPETAKEVRLSTLVRFVIEDCRLNLVAMPYIASLRLTDAVRVPVEYVISVKFAENLRLKALDLLHIAYAYMLKSVIDAFVTADDDILEKREIIKKIAGIEIKHPEAFL